jgi:type II secretory ATPase GspE/PulE/Tfp pilus assembly ATPase PilB-like protein
MVGEIRDKETAEIAMKAAQTGHLLLSTLHTNDSFSAIVRLLDLGIPGYLISSSLTGILAQRLVRLLCSCHSVEPSTSEFQERMRQLGLAAPPREMAVAVGCDRCNQTGYRGRIGIYELLVVDESIRNVIRNGGNVGQMRETSRAGGMRLLQEDAVAKVLNGLTTLEEILRVVPMRSAARLECSNCKSHILSAYHFCPTCGTPCSSRTVDGGARSHDLVPEGVL